MSWITETLPKPPGWIAELQEEYLRTILGNELYEDLERQVDELRYRQELLQELQR